MTLDGLPVETKTGEHLIDLLLRTGSKIPYVCYHTQLGRIQTCDTYMVEVNGQLVRACATTVSAGMDVATKSPRADAAQREAFDRILGNHMLYCTVCDNNNGNCTVHNTTKMLAIEHQNIPFKTKPYEADHTNPFYRYDPDQCILCGRCVEACQNVQVNETLSGRAGAHPYRAARVPLDLRAQMTPCYAFVVLFFVRINGAAMPTAIAATMRRQLTESASVSVTRVVGAAAPASTI